MSLLLARGGGGPSNIFETVTCVWTWVTSHGQEALAETVTTVDTWVTSTGSEASAWTVTEGAWAWATSHGLEATSWVVTETDVWVTSHGLEALSQAIDNFAVWAWVTSITEALDPPTGAAPAGGWIRQRRRRIS